MTFDFAQFDSFTIWDFAAHIIFMHAIIHCLYSVVYVAYFAYLAYCSHKGASSILDECLKNYMKKSVLGIEIAFTIIGIVIASRMIEVVMYLKMKESQ
jgi:hypothetical protein